MNIKRKKPVSRTGICIYCGKEFHTYVDRKKFCNRTCREAMYRQIRLQKNNGQDLVEKECPYCHKIFIMSSVFKIFCSADCKTNNMREQREHVLAKTRRTQICANCETPFVTHKSRQIYCSSTCRKESRNKYRKPIGRVEKCPTCGTPFIVTKNGQRYCSAACRKSEQIKRPQQAFGNKRLCAFCGKQFDVMASNQKYCTVDCQRKNFERTTLQRKEERKQRLLQRAIYLTN